MKSVLYIGAGAPWLGGAGYLVHQRMFLRALAEVAELHLAMFDLPADANTSKPEFVRSLIPLPKVTRDPESGITRIISDLFLPMPRMFRSSRCEEARAVVAGLHPEKFDAVFSFRIDFGHFAGVLDHPRLLLDIDDPEHLRWRRQLAATTKNGGDWRTLRDLDKLARFEKRAARNAVASFVCQEHDRKAFDPPPVVVPNCVDVPESCPPRRAEKPRVILVGNFSAASPNVDALRWMLDEIWPLIRAGSPECEFHVIGKLAGELASRVASTPGAVAAGFVENLADEMSRASLSLAPIRFGTGTRVKILESFALGCPVVSTTLGAEGIEARPSEEILIGDTSADFAARCLELLNDRGLQSQIAASAFDVAVLRYSERGRRAELAATLGALLEKCTASGMGGPPMSSAAKHGRAARATTGGEAA